MRTKIIATLVCIFLYDTLACAQGYKRPESYNYQRGVEAIQNENPQEALEYLNKDIAENPKNLFCGNHDAAEDAAVIYTFMGCCR